MTSLYYVRRYLTQRSGIEAMSAPAVGSEEAGREAGKRDTGARDTQEEIKVCALNVVLRLRSEGTWSRQHRNSDQRWSSLDQSERRGKAKGKGITEGK